jgi:hypothetical protein
MAAIVRHATTVVTADDGSEVGANAWNAAHVVTGSTVAYGVSWNGSSDVPSMDVLYDKIETITARNVLASDTTYYLRANLGTVTFDTTNDLVNLTSHGLSAGDAVVFSAPEDMLVEVSLSIASPCVATKTAHGLVADDTFHFETSFAGLPTNVSANTLYYVLSSGLTADAFTFSASSGGAAINSAGASTGEHYVFRNATFPTNITGGTVYYVISSGLTSSAFKVSTTLNGSAVDIAGTPVGKFQVSTGSDSNDGSTATRAGAFLTAQAAYDYIVDNIDLAGFIATIQYADSKYTDNASGAHVDLENPWTGGGHIKFNGNSSKPTNVDVQPGSSNGFELHTAMPGAIYIQQMYITTTGFHDSIGGQSGQGAGICYIKGVVFGAADWHMGARNTSMTIETLEGSGLGSDGFGQGYSHIIRAATSPGGHAIAIDGGCILLDWPYTALNSPSLAGGLAYVQNGGMISQNNGGNINGAYTGTIFTAKMGFILNSESFDDGYFFSASANPTGGRSFSAGGVYNGKWIGGGQGVVFSTSRGIIDDALNRQLLFIKGSTAATNYLTVTNASSANVPVIGSMSTVATDVDLRLSPQGAGNVSFGTFASTASEVITGYITIKDAAGNARKLAVIS